MASTRSRHLTLAQGCAGPNASAPPSPLFLGHGHVGTGLPMFGAERLLWLRRSGVVSWAKAGDFVLSRGCLVVGRRLGRWEARRLGAERASQVQAGNHGRAGGVVAGG